MILCGDIGGTHARLALTEEGTTAPVRERHYSCADFPGLEPILEAFLAQEAAPITAGCLAVAGPVADDGRRARLTNLPWTIDADALARRFGLRHLVLVNDFSAAALGITACPPESLVILQAGEPLPDGPRLVVGAGTGLGMAVLLPETGGWRVLAGEGGHAAFGPTDLEQADLWQHLHRRHGRVTAERVVSGPGLESIHEFLAGTRTTAEAIAREAAADPSSPAARAVRLFLTVYGAFAGDMAMAVMARGGVYLAGGIAARLLPLVKQGPLLQAFNDKAEHALLMRGMPLSVAIDPALGLRGAALFAALTASRK